MTSDGGATARGRRALRGKRPLLIEPLIDQFPGIFPKGAARAYPVKYPNTRGQNIAVTIIFAYEIAIELEGATWGHSKSLKNSLSKHTRAATFRCPKRGFYFYTP